MLPYIPHTAIDDFADRFSENEQAIRSVINSLYRHPGISYWIREQTDPFDIASEDILRKNAELATYGILLNYLADVEPNFPIVAQATACSFNTLDDNDYDLEGIVKAENPALFHDLILRPSNGHLVMISDIFYDRLRAFIELDYHQFLNMERDTALDGMLSIYALFRRQLHIFEFKQEFDLRTVT